MSRIIKQLDKVGKTIESSYDVVPVDTSVFQFHSIYINLTDAYGLPVSHTAGATVTRITPTKGSMQLQVYGACNSLLYPISEITVNFDQFKLNTVGTRFAGVSLVLPLELVTQAAVIKMTSNTLSNVATVIGADTIAEDALEFFATIYVTSI